MNSNTAVGPAITQPGQARAIRAFGDEAIILLDSEQTGGKFTMWINVTPAGGGPPPHYHLNEDEWFVVQEGRLQFLVNGETREVGVGGAVFVPRGSVHTFKNIGDRPSRLLVTTSPSGFEKFFTRCAEEFGKPGGPSMPRLVEISAEHGIHFVQA